MCDGISVEGAKRIVFDFEVRINLGFVISVEGFCRNLGFCYKRGFGLGSLKKDLLYIFVLFFC